MEPSQESVECMLTDFEYHGVIGPRRDVFDDVLGVLRAYLTLTEELKTERAERIKWQRIRKPTHGTCCTCQKCGLDHDSCRCDLDEVVDELEQVKAESQELKEKLKTALTEIVPEKLIGLSIEGKNILDFWYVWIIQYKDEMAKLEADNQALKARLLELEA